MPDIRIRIRGPSGNSTLTLPSSATVSDLKDGISSQSGLPAFTLKYSYPPKPLDLDQFALDVRLCDTGVRFDGEQLIAAARDIAAPLQQPLRSPPPAAGAPSAPTQQPPATGVPAVGLPRKPLQLSRRTNSATDEPPEIAVPALGGTLVMRVMPDDNSCLFRALGKAILGGALDGMTELRSVVAQAIQSNPELYGAAVLEREPDAYCKWIQREESWGGAIEIGIIATEFGVEVCSVNVQDLRVDRFNEGAGTRCVLVYSGIHYDVLALSPSEPPHVKSSSPPEFDTTVFDSGPGVGDVVLSASLELCKELQRRQYFTDTQGFAIRCNICGWTGKGEKAALNHAQQTGHSDFGES